MGPPGLCWESGRQARHLDPLQVAQNSVILYLIAYQRTKLGSVSPSQWWMVAFNQPTDLLWKQTSRTAKPVQRGNSYRVGSVVAGRPSMGPMSSYQPELSYEKVKSSPPSLVGEVGGKEGSYSDYSYFPALVRCPISRPL